MEEVNATLGSGQLSEKELRAALVNGDWTSFDPHTVRMMIRYDFQQISVQLPLLNAAETGCLIPTARVPSGLASSGWPPPLHRVTFHDVS